MILGVSELFYRLIARRDLLTKLGVCDRNHILRIVAVRVECGVDGRALRSLGGLCERILLVETLTGQRPTIITKSQTVDNAIKTDLCVIATLRRRRIFNFLNCLYSFNSDLLSVKPVLICLDAQTNSRDGWVGKNPESATKQVVVIKTKLVRSVFSSSRLIRFSPVFGAVESLTVYFALLGVPTSSSVVLSNLKMI